MTDTYLQQNKVVSHCWSPDQSHVAVSIRNTNVVEIYKVQQQEKVASWVKVKDFKDSSLQVSALAWSADNKILSGSYDRSIFVYRQEEGRWQKDLVICQNKLSILTGEWSKNGYKFVIGTGCHHAYVGYYEQTNSWWNTAQIDGFGSSVTAACFHPSGRVVALGSSDFSIKLVTCFITDKEQKLNHLEDLTYKGVYFNVESFGEVLIKTQMQGWINDIQFSPNGLKFIACNQVGQIDEYIIVSEESITVGKSGESNIYKPFTKIRYVNDKTIIGVGYDRKPIKISAETLQFQEKIDVSVMGSLNKETVSSLNAARNMFEKNKNKTPENAIGKYDHQTCITCVNVLDQNTISTSDVNGLINIWKI